MRYENEHPSAFAQIWWCIDAMVIPALIIGVLWSCWALMTANVPGYGG